MYIYTQILRTYERYLTVLSEYQHALFPDYPHLRFSLWVYLQGQPCCSPHPQYRLRGPQGPLQAGEAKQ